jgi:hypothetical protein
LILAKKKRIRGYFCLSNIFYSIFRLYFTKNWILEKENNKKKVKCKKEIRLAYQVIHVIEFQIFIDYTLAERNANVICWSGAHMVQKLYELETKNGTF